MYGGHLTIGAATCGVGVAIQDPPFVQWTGSLAYVRISCISRGSGMTSRIDNENETSLIIS